MHRRMRLRLRLRARQGVSSPEFPRTRYYEVCLTNHAVAGTSSLFNLGGTKPEEKKDEKKDGAAGETTMLSVSDLHAHFDLAPATSGFSLFGAPKEGDKKTETSKIVGLI